MSKTNVRMQTGQDRIKHFFPSASYGSLHFLGKDAALQVSTILVLNLPRVIMKKNYRVKTELESFR